MITISKANKEDLDMIQEVSSKTWLATYPNEDAGISTEDIQLYLEKRNTPEARAKRTDSFEENSPSSCFIVAKEGAKVIGFARSLNEGDVNRLGAIYVLPESQGKGVGKLLWSDTFNFFTNNNDWVVNVATYNKSAINFYKKLGFQETEKVFIDEKFKMPISGNHIPEMEMRLKR